MCRYMLHFEVRMSRSVSACVDTCWDLKQNESIHKEDASTHSVKKKQDGSMHSVLCRCILNNFDRISFKLL